jgi:hypothetical protein
MDFTWESFLSFVNRKSWAWKSLLGQDDENKLTGRLGTEQASTSGTSIDFTGIPAWAKRITIMFVGVSTSGNSFGIIQLGDAGGVETTGYLSVLSTVDTGAGATALTTGFGATGGGATAFYHGSVTLSLEDSAGFTWVASGVLNRSDVAQTFQSAGSKSLSAALDRVRITTVNGTDTFDAGAINIIYE